MRRVLSLALLVAVTWPHLALMKCAVAPHGSQGQHTEWNATQHDHDGPDCPALMACSAAMVEGSVEGGLVVPPNPPTAYETAVKAAITTADPATEPPPPRRSA